MIVVPRLAMVGHMINIWTILAGLSLLDVAWWTVARREFQTTQASSAEPSDTGPHGSQTPWR